MSTELDGSGDYGYDLVHEVKVAQQIPSPPRCSPVGRFRAERAEDADGDYGYDMVHEQ